MKRPSILPRRYAQAGSGTRRGVEFAALGTRWKLFAVCGLLVLVLAAAEQARKPESWRVFEQLDEQAKRDNLPPDPRIFQRHSRTQHDPLGTFVSSEDKLEAASAADGPLPADLTERAWQSGWKDILPNLQGAERGTLYEVLWRSREHMQLSGELGSQLALAAEALDGHWTAYQTDALASLLELPAADQANWSMVIAQTDIRWKQQLKPALQSLCDGRSPTEAELKELIAWQMVLDDLQLRAVKDDTVWRGSEREIWFRLLERVRAGRGEAEAPFVTYGQLFKQPKDYRGQWVSIRGSARQAYRVRAPENWLEIPYYYVFVVQPEDGANSPIIVYSLDIPPDLPPIKDKDLDRSTTILREDVEFTGLFFKRWAYLGQNGTYVAPLVLAKTGVVHHTPSFRRPEQLPSNSQLAWLVGGVLALSLLVTGFAFWITGRKGSSIPQPAPSDIARSLAALERDQQREGSP